MKSFAYLFERFPSFVQTFVYREAVEMVRQGMAPWLVSIRRPEDPGELAAKLDAEIFYPPPEKELRDAVDAQRSARTLPRAMHKAIPKHRTEPDAQRMFEAIWLAPRLREAGIRHVHAHFGGMAARTAWWLRKLAGIGYSYTGHANDIFCEGGFPVSNAMLARDARFIVTETAYARHWMEQHHPVARGKVFCVFNGIDTSGFPPRESAVGVPLILSVGRLVEKKGFDVLIEACRLLHRRGVAFQCEIVGEGPLEETLRAQIAAAGLDASVRLSGPLSQEDVRRKLAQANVFALACVLEADGGSDNLPTVVVEAMVAGLPVVSTRMAGLPEMITHESDGLLVEPRDAAAFSEAVARLLADAAFAGRIAKAARETAVEKFSIETTTCELKHLLLRLAPVESPSAARERDANLPRPGLATRFGWLFR